MSSGLHRNFTILLLCVTFATNHATSTTAIDFIVNDFLKRLTDPVEQMLRTSAQILATTFHENVGQLCDRNLFTRGSYAQHYNTTFANAVDALRSIRAQNTAIRQQARVDLQSALQVLRELLAESADDELRDFEFIYREYEDGYRIIHRLYREDVQCNYMLLYDRGLIVNEIMAEPYTFNVAHLDYQMVVRNVHRMNAGNRREIEAQTETLLANVAISLRKIGRSLDERMN